jgi:uncharacterized protein (TIGR03083 family)
MDYAAVIEDESTALAAALRLPGALTGSVPACPGWTGDDLARHIGEVQGFWAAVFRAGGPQPDHPEDVPGERDVLEWYDEMCTGLVKAVRETAPDQTLWQWWRPGGDSAREVARRQAHEALVHRFDAESILGVPRPLAPPELAADGVREYCERMLSGAGPWTGPSGVLRLVAGDTGNEWLLRLDPSPALVESGDPVATVTGSASDLDLWVWRRTSEVSVEGDASVVAAFHAWAELS